MRATFPACLQKFSCAAIAAGEDESILRRVAFQTIEKPPKDRPRRSPLEIPLLAFFS